MTTDFRALCAELVEKWNTSTLLGLADAMDRASAALSAPEQGPTDEQIMELMPEQLWKDLAAVSRLAAHGAGPDVGPGLFRVTLNAGIVEHCRAVLARWGRPAVEPVPVAERLPKDSDCGWWPNEKKPECYQWCWLWDGSKWERYQVGHMLGCKLPDVFTHWLPHWALPVPQQRADG